jgi:hypothetical protein
VTAFERRSSPGGLWAFSEDPTLTSVTSCTKAQLSKFLVRPASYLRHQCVLLIVQIPYTDFPAPDGTYNPHLLVHLLGYTHPDGSWQTSPFIPLLPTWLLTIRLMQSTLAYLKG